LLDELGLRAVPLTGQRDELAEHGLVYLERRGAKSRDETVGVQV